MSGIKSRKDEHLDIVLDGRAAPSGPHHPFDAFAFQPEAAPQLSLRDVDLSTTFLDRRLKAPLLISSMTGGPARAEHINRALAEAAEATGIAMAVGSQRIALEDAGAAGLAKDLRRAAPSIPLFANIGAAQVAIWQDPGRVLRAVDMIEADALIIHFNALQEALQPEGDTDWTSLNAALAALASASPVPLVAKEVGCGISGETAARLCDLGFSAVDVAGRGGTSWAAVEAERAHGPDAADVAAPFRNWGMSTPQALLSVRGQLPDVPLIASGGIRNGLDGALAIRLGGDLVGQAAHLLEPALSGTEAVVSTINVTVNQLKIALFCTGSADLAALRRAPLMPPVMR